MSSSFIALIAAIVGGTLVEIIRRFAERQERKRLEAKQSLDDSAQIEIKKIEDRSILMRELWDEIAKLRERVDIFSDEISKQKEINWQQRSRIERLEDENKELREENNKLKIEVAKLKLATGTDG